MTTSDTPNGYGGISTEIVQFSGHNGDSIGGYLARPAGPGPYPGVIVIPEIFGLVDHARELTFKFAGHGYVALAPDLWHREGPGAPEDVSAKVRGDGGVPDDRCIGDCEGAATHLKGLDYCTGKLGVIGFCSGGRQVVLFSCNTSSLSAAVSCYGGRVVQPELSERMPKAPIDMISGLQCPLMNLSGDEDQNPSPEQVERLRQEMETHGKTFESHSYPEAGHAFFADYRPSYRQAAAVEGWQHVFEYFEKYLS